MVDSELDHEGADAARCAGHDHRVAVLDVGGVDGIEGPGTSKRDRRGCLEREARGLGGEGHIRAGGNELRPGADMQRWRRGMNPSTSAPAKSGPTTVGRSCGISL